jgi:hypothetical protein
VSDTTDLVDYPRYCGIQNKNGYKAKPAYLSQYGMDGRGLIPGNSSPTQQVLGHIPRGIMRLEREADYYLHLVPRFQKQVEDSFLRTY